MNKKFLSAILFGALMVSSTGTFVSCKDYDDDIDELTSRVDGVEGQILSLIHIQMCIRDSPCTEEICGRYQSTGKSKSRDFGRGLPRRLDCRHFSENSMTFIMVLAGLSMTVGNLMGGKFSDQYGACLLYTSILIMRLICIINFSFLNL